MALLHLEIGRRLYNAGSWEEAVVELDRALVLCPRLWQCLYYRAKAHASLGKMLCAYKDLHRALQLGEVVLALSILFLIVVCCRSDE